MQHTGLSTRSRGPFAACVSLAALTQLVACGDASTTETSDDELLSSSRFDARPERAPWAPSDDETLSPSRPRRPRCDPGNAGLTLPPGFCALVVAENVGRARQLVVTRAGDLYVAVNPARDGSDPGRVIALRDRDGDGRTEQVVTLADTGGNGIALDALEVGLYVAHNDHVARYLLLPGRLRPLAGPATIVSGLPATGDHTAKTIVLDHRGGFYLNIGSGSNTCQVENRVPFSPGVDPCPELDVRAGVWHFPTLRRGQTQADGARFATGTRNMNALDLRPGTSELWGVQNGRDQLFENWPDRFTEADDREAPAEEVLHLTRGYDNGWPYCFEDPRLGYKVLAPEYGGDGRAVGRCARVPRSSLTMPAHWAPLSMAFYTGRMFPESYRGDAFVATHGARFPSASEGAGYNVMRVRFAHGEPVSREVFADGFAVDTSNLPDSAENRPVGLAQGPDGSLYITSDQGSGRIWRVMYDAHAAR